MTGPSARYPRDLVGYGRKPPHARWPNGARIAVWLAPKSGWRKNYADWPALHKLQAVDELVTSVRGLRAPVRNRLRIEPLEHNRRTLAQHYRRKLDPKLSRLG